MKKSTIILAILGLALYGLVLVVTPGINTLIAIGSGLVVAVLFLFTAFGRSKVAWIEKRSAWVQLVPLYVIFLLIPGFL